jgi:hypothetical protein
MRTGESMSKFPHILVATVVGAATLLSMGGCPVAGTPAADVIAGGTGASNQLGNTASVTVLSPAVSLSITGGTPIEVNWTAIATTNFAAVNVIFDVDQDPDNGNEILASQNLDFSETRELVDTSGLPMGTFFIGVVLLETNEIAAFAYADGAVIVNEQSDLVFSSPRGNLSFERSIDVTPRFDVAWTVTDPDSTVTVRIFLDPDATPNGNEIALRESTSQTGDGFSFNLPTSSFEPGTYRILAIVSDENTDVAVYAPASIRISARLGGVIDLRDLGTNASPVSGAVFEGFNPRDNTGSFVTSLSDYDGDGFSDFIMVAQFGKPVYQSNLQRVGVGESYMVYGRATRFSGKISVNSTGALFRGEVITGVREVLDGDPIRPSRGISSLALLSDWDGDGFREMAFGVPFVDSTPEQILDAAGYFRTGAVVVASSTSLRPDLNFPGGNVMILSEIGTLDHRLNTIPDCPEGFSGPKSPPAPGGGSTTYFSLHQGGERDGPANRGSIRLGCRLSTTQFGDQCGETVSAYQFNSLIMSVPNRDPIFSTLNQSVGSAGGAGVVSIYYCHVDSGFFPWDAQNAPPGTITSPAGEALLPHDGPFHYVFDDFVNGSPGFVVDADDSMPCLLVANGLLPNAVTTNSFGNSRTTRFYSTQPNSRLSNVQGADDFNGDGLQELLIGAPFLNNGAGAVFIVLGRLRPLVEGGELDLNELAQPLNSAAGNERIFDGIQIVGEPGTRLGQSQDAIGDFNSDGLPDVAIGSPLLNDRRGGAAVLFGSRDLINSVASEISLSDIPERGLGVIFVGENEGDLAGIRVARAGDVDGDSNGDLLIAAPDKSVRLDTDLDGVLEIDREQCGVVYLVYGGPHLKGTLNLADIGTSKLPGMMFVGRNSGDHLGAGLGEQGDRSKGIAAAGDVDGDGLGDLILGAVNASPRDRVHAGEAYLIYGVGN